MFNLNCIKCHKPYQDTDPEPYYCEPCNEERKRIAAEVDLKMASRPTKNVIGATAQYDMAPKVNGFMVVKN